MVGVCVVGYGGCGLDWPAGRPSCRPSERDALLTLTTRYIDGRMRRTSILLRRPALAMASRMTQSPAMSAVVKTGFFFTSTAC